MPLNNRKFIKDSLFFASFLMVLSVSAENRPGKATFGMRIGENTVEAYADLLHPVIEFNNAALLFNPRFSYKDEGENELNAGLIYRHLMFSESVAVGANVYGDSRKSRNGNRFNQLGLGLELLSNWFDARVNWYDADSTPELINEFTETEIDTFVSRQASRQTITEQLFGDPFARVHSIKQGVTTNTSTTTILRTTTTTVQTDRLFQEFEAGLDGYDAEMGVKLPLFQPVTDVRIFVGKYDFEGEFGRNVEGYKSRLEVRAGPSITFDAEIFEDDQLNGTDYFIGARFHIPLYGKDTWRNFRESFRSSKLPDFKERIYSDMVMRDVRVQMNESDPIEDQARFKQKTDVDVDTQRSASTTSSTVNVTIKSNVTFVDGDNNSGKEDGTAEHPYNTPQEGSDNAVGKTIFIHEVSGGTGTYSTNVALRSNQTLTSTISALGGKKFETRGRPVIAPDLGTAGVIVSDTENVVINRIAINTADADGITTVGGLGGTGDFTVMDSVITTTGDDAYGIFYEGDAAGSIVFRGNDISTDGVESYGIAVENETPGQAGSIAVKGNLVTTTGDESVGISILTDSFSSIVSGNNVSTEGDDFAFAIIIENDGDASAVIDNNTIATIGDNGSHGAIIDSNGAGSSQISNNNIMTFGDFGIGIVSDNEDGAGNATVKNNLATTDGEDSDGILLISGAGSASATNNNITTKDEDSFGIYSIIDGDGMTTISGNTILTMKEDSVGVFAETDNGGDDGAITIKSNNITTQGDFADGVVTISDEAGAVVISSNNVSTSGGGAEGVDTDNDGTGTTLISSNKITTAGDEVAGDDADGIDSDNDSTGATIIANNTVTTTGVEAEGIDTENDGVGAGASIITGNTVTTTDAGSEAIRTDDQCSQISSNTINAMGGGANAIDTTSSLALGNVANGAEVAGLQAANTIISGGVVATGGTGLGAGVACP